MHISDVHYATLLVPIMNDNTNNILVYATTLVHVCAILKIKKGF